MLLPFTIPLSCFDHFTIILLPFTIPLFCFYHFTIILLPFAIPLFCFYHFTFLSSPSHHFTKPDSNIFRWLSSTLLVAE